MFLPFQLDRTVRIQATPDTVFTFFTDSERWASWWGAGSTIEPRVGGRMYIRYPNGIEAAGEVIEIAPSERIAFTYGFVSGQPVAVGSSRVIIRLEPDGTATRLHLTHEFADSGARDEHVQGWRYQLSVFGQVATALVNAGAAALVDDWFAAWSETDTAARSARVSRVAAADVRFSDRYSLLEGIDDLLPHIAATQRFMPDLRLQRNGAVRHSQGTLLVDWTAVSSDGQPRGSGTNVFTVRGDGLIAAVVGFWS